MDGHAHRLLREQRPDLDPAGWRVVQEGVIVDVPADPKATFADRAQGFKIGLLDLKPSGHGYPVTDDLLLGDAHRWAHLTQA